MNVLIVGGGGREHALTWKALQSPLTDTVFCAPGNAATGAMAINTGLQATDVEGIARFVIERDVGLTVIGPEVAVAAGLADRLTAAGGRLVLDEKMGGGEVALMAFVDGARILPLAPACDYKRAFDGDKGPNTGGMGGYSPVSFFGQDAVVKAATTVLAPIVDGLRD